VEFGNLWAAVAIAVIMDVCREFFGNA
jgi:hypothetical protein